MSHSTPPPPTSRTISRGDQDNSTLPYKNSTLKTIISHYYVLFCIMQLYFDAIQCNIGNIGKNKINNSKNNQNDKVYTSIGSTLTAEPIVTMQKRF